MNKQQLLDQSRAIGSDIVSLVNEYRNSEGENCSLDEAYFGDFFGGLIAWLSSGEGSLTVECASPEKEDSIFIDGHVFLQSEVKYPFHNNLIHDHMTVAESTRNTQQGLQKDFGITMDPITYLYYLMGTNYKGTKLFDGSKEEVNLGD